MFTARNDTGLLVGFTIFSLPGQLLLSRCVVRYLGTDYSHRTTSEEQMSNANFKDYMVMMSREGRDFFATVVCVL